MKKILGIIGSGDLGKQIAHFAISDNHYEDVVFFDDFNKSSVVNGFPILGDLSVIQQEFENNSFNEIIIAIGYKHLKQKKLIYQSLNGKIPFGRIIHSTSYIDETSIIEDGCVIYPNCAIDAGVKVGKNTIINIGCTIAHDTKVHGHCFFSPRVAIAGFVEIGDCCFIGINSTVIDNLNIYPNIKIGGGSLVINNLTNDGLYVGSPVRRIKNS
jgi:sugar O-acyltransferase (sialic acid O-acetyltransferase NeuD family)